jgi:hypothetical protein
MAAVLLAILVIGPSCCETPEDQVPTPIKDLPDLIFCDAGPRFDAASSRAVIPSAKFKTRGGLK